MPATIALRPYQEQAIEGLRDGFRAGHHRQMLVAPTGAGKTLVSAYLMQEAKKKGTRSAFVVDRIALVDQTSAVLDTYGIDHGVIQAGHWRRRLYEPIQICSAQTLEKRGFFPDLSLLIVDEAHCVREKTAQLIRNRDELKVLALTATPFTKGLGELYTNVVNVTTTNTLIAEGYLCPLKMYAAVSPDMSGAKIVAGEWSDKEVEERGLTIIGDIVSEWSKKTEEHFGGPAKTIVFSATVDHGEEICRQFRAAGYRFEQISYRDTDDEKRRALISEFRKPDSQIVGLVSCEVLTKGFDVPDVLVGVSARPYRKSLSSHIQQLGRVMRPSPGKTFGLWLDHSGNVHRFHQDTLDVWENGVPALVAGALDDKVRKDPDEKVMQEIKCPRCKLILPPRCEVCPGCGLERKRQSLVEAAAGEMVMVGGAKKPAEGKYAFLANRNDVWRQLATLAMERKNGDAEKAQKWAQAQFNNIYGEFIRRRVENTPPTSPSYQLQQLVTANMIRFAKRAAKGGR